MNLKTSKLNLYLFVTLIQLCLTSPASAQKSTLTGEIKGIGKTPIQFIYKQNGKTKRDTVYATNDRFTYIPQPGDDGTFDVFIRNPRWIGLWYEQAALTLSGSAERPYQLSVKGGPENDAATHYNETIRWVYLDKRAAAPREAIEVLSREEQAKTIQFIRDNPSVKISAELLLNLTYRDDISLDQLEALYQTLAPAVQKSSPGTDAAKQIEIVRNQPVKGKAAPNFKLQSTDGTNVSLSSFQGKYVLLDFWGHWCGPCIKAMPALRGLQERYAGKLTIIGIAAEYADDRDTWLNTIAKHQANWVQLSEFEGDKGEVNTTYNIVQFPTYFLLDRKGVILGKVNDITAVEQLLSGLGDL